MASQAAEQLLDSQLILHLRASKYYMLASVVILYFDYVLTFDLEIRNLWRKRWTGPAVLFLLNRYYPMLMYVVVLAAVHTPSWSGEACENFKRFPLLGALFSEAIIGIIVILRLYAFYAKSLRIICVLAPLYVAQFLIGGWAADAVVQATGLPPDSGCIITVPNGLAHRFAWLWGSAALFDSLGFGLTLYRVLPLRYSGLKLPLTTLILRDGTVYFAVMFSARLLNFILFFTVLPPDLITLNWTFNNTITVIMINRLVLNLRQESSKDVVTSKWSARPMHAQQFMSTFVAEFEGSLLTDTEIDDTYMEKSKEDFVVSSRLQKDAVVQLEEGKW